MDVAEDNERSHEIREDAHLLVDENRARLVLIRHGRSIPTRARPLSGAGIWLAAEASYCWRRP